MSATGREETGIIAWRSGDPALGMRLSCDCYDSAKSDSNRINSGSVSRHNLADFRDKDKARAMQMRWIIDGLKACESDG